MLDPLRVHWQSSWGDVQMLANDTWTGVGVGVFTRWGLLPYWNQEAPSHSSQNEGKPWFVTHPSFFAPRHKLVSLLLRLRSTGTAVSQLLWFLCLWRKCWDLFCCIHHKPLQTILDKDRAGNIITGLFFAKLLKDPNQGYVGCFIFAFLLFFITLS